MMPIIARHEILPLFDMIMALAASVSSRNLGEEIGDIAEIIEYNSPPENLCVAGSFEGAHQIANHGFVNLLQSNVIHFNGK